MYVHVCEYECVCARTCVCGLRASRGCCVRAGALLECACTGPPSVPGVERGPRRRVCIPGKKKGRQRIPVPTNAIDSGHGGHARSVPRAAPQAVPARVDVAARCCGPAARARAAPRSPPLPACRALAIGAVCFGVAAQPGWRRLAGAAHYGTSMAAGPRGCAALPPPLPRNEVPIKQREGTRAAPILAAAALQGGLYALLRACARRGRALTRSPRASAAAGPIASGAVRSCGPWRGPWRMPSGETRGGGAAVVAEPPPCRAVCGAAL